MKLKKIAGYFTGKTINAETGKVEQPVALGRRNQFALVALTILALQVVFGWLSSAMAQTNSFPDPTTIYTGLASPFNSALSWVIGAIAVLTLIGWILVAVRRRR